MDFSTIETRLRRYLRDPDAEVWSQKLLIDLFNQAQEEFNKDTKILEKVCSIRVPPLVDYVSFYDWEEEFMDGKAMGLLCGFTATLYTCTQEWEIESWMGISSAVNGGYRSTFPWERHETGITVLGREIYKFPEDFLDLIMLIYDRVKLFPISEEAAMKGNSDYQTREGTPQYYYRMHTDQERDFVLYPRVQTIVRDDMSPNVPDIDCGYSVAWEVDHIPSESVTYSKFAETSDATYAVVYAWEEHFVDLGDDPPASYDFDGYYATNSYDTTVVPHHNSIVVGVDPDTNTMLGEGGTLADLFEAYSDTDTGVVIDYITLDNHLLCIYKPKSTKVLISTDEIQNWLDWMVKYIERKTLSLAYLINNDRYNPDMSKVWNLRYKDGLGVMARYKSKRTVGRRPRLKGSGNRRWQSQLVDLPDTFESLHK